MDLKSFAHGYGQLSYHIVTAPKYRYDIFSDPEIRDACEQIFVKHHIAESQGNWEKVLWVDEFYHLPSTERLLDFLPVSQHLHLVKPH